MKLSKLQLDQCQNCTKRGFGQMGVLCSLTNAKEEFRGDCDNFEMDEKVENYNKRIYGGGDLGIWGGLSLLIIGVLWLILGYVILNKLFILPVFMVIGGIISMAKGADIKKKRKSYEEIIDDEIF